MASLMKKSRIRDTKHFWTDAGSSTDTQKILLVRQNSSKNKLFFVRPFFTLYEQKCSNLRPLLSITFPKKFRKSKKFGHWTSGSKGKKTFKRSEQMKKSVKNFFCTGNYRPFLSKNVQIWDHFFPLLLPKDSESLKILHIWLGKMGAKIRLNGTSKVNTQTNTRTNTPTFRLIESISPGGSCFENIWRINSYVRHCKENHTNKKYNLIYKMFYFKNIYIYILTTNDSWQPPCQTLKCFHT